MAGSGAGGAAGKAYHHLMCRVGKSPPPRQKKTHINHFMSSRKNSEADPVTSIVWIKIVNSER